MNLGTRARTYLAAEALLLMNLPDHGQKVPFRYVGHGSTKRIFP